MASGLGSLLVSIVLTQAALSPTAVVVVDVSAPDAVYEDVSRALAEEVVTALGDAGLAAVRIDENELPEKGCRIGPCLGQVAKARHARAVVIVDATELDKKRTAVSVAAMAARDGMPIGAKRYAVKEGAKAPKDLKAFATEIARKLLPAPDAGAPASK
jgi:hypothetical protein